MKFVFQGTIEELKETIYLKAKECGKDIVVYHNEPNLLKIGFQRLGHGGGRFFVASIKEEYGKVILEGEIKEIFYNEEKKSKAGRIWIEFKEYLAAYIFLEILLVVPWLFIKNIVSVWVLMALPFIYLIIRHFLNKKYDEKSDNEFKEFMSLCAIHIV